MRKNGLGQGNPGRESAMLAIRLNESYKLADSKKLPPSKNAGGAPNRGPRDPTKLLFAWGGRIRENFVGADDLAVEGTRN